MSLRLLMLGAPGAGKGTYARVLTKAFNVPHIASGDIVRHHVAQKTELGLQMKEKYDAGQLVDDEIIIPLMEERLFHSTDTQHGGQFILDGFPRNLQQAQQFDRMMSKHSSSLATVLNLQLRSDILVQKACMRRTCPRCGEGYNLAHIIEPENGIFMPALAPKKEGECDHCEGEKLAQRDDDQEDIIEERLRVYEEMTQPLIEFYKEKEQQQASSSLSFIDFDVSKGRDATTPILMEIFHRLFPGFTVEDESRA